MSDKRSELVKLVIGSLLLSYILAFTIAIIQIFSNKRVNYYLISLVIVSQSSIAGPILGFYFADSGTKRPISNRDEENMKIIKSHEREKLEEFDKRLK